MAQRRYDKDTDVLEHSVLAVSATTGGYGNGLILRTYRAGKWGAIATPDDLHLSNKSGLVAWTAKVLRTLERKEGIPGWVVCGRTGLICHVPDDWKPGVAKRKQITSLCWELVHDATGVGAHACGRPIIGDDELCRMHRAGRNRSAANRESWQEERNRYRDEADRAGMMTQDLRDLWGRVCAQRDVMHPGKDPMVRTDACALVDASSSTG